LHSPWAPHWSGGLSACVPLVVGGAAVVGVGMVATDRRSSGAQLDDQGIELRAAARVRDIANDNMYVSVTSYNRQVLLTGAVGSDADRRRVEDEVSRIVNVRSVVNELTVGASSTFQDRSNDLYITGKVKASLLDAKDIFANSFKVVTERGTVYLMGIATRRETDRATEITRGVTGVARWCAWSRSCPKPTWPRPRPPTRPRRNAVARARRR
jgi:osmotically-inducible protein OsmY